MEEVDILKPPKFEKNGQTKSIEKAREDENWIGSFNLWIIKENPFPSLIYQIRSPRTIWEPNKLDVSAAGKYTAGEDSLDGLREVKEELGKTYLPNTLSYIGRKINISPDKKGRMQKTVAKIYFVVDNSKLETYKLQKSEVYAIGACKIKDLIKLHKEEEYSFETEIITANKERKKYKVTKNKFPYNWDNYHLKIALLAKRFLKGEKDLIY